MVSTKEQRGVEVSSRPIRDEEGRVVGVQVIRRYRDGSTEVSAEPLQVEPPASQQGPGVRFEQPRLTPRPELRRPFGLEEIEWERA